MAHQPVSFSEILLSSGDRFNGGAFMNVTPEEAKGLRELLGQGNSDAVVISCSELERLQPGLDQLLGPGSTARLCRGPVRVRVFAQLGELHALGIARFS